MSHLKDIDLCFLGSKGQCCDLPPCVPFILVESFLAESHCKMIFICVCLFLNAGLQEPLTVFKLCLLFFKKFAKTHWCFGIATSAICAVTMILHCEAESKTIVVSEA